MNLKRLLKLGRFLRVRKLFKEPGRTHVSLSYAFKAPREVELEFRDGSRIRLEKRTRTQWLWDYFLGSKEAWPVQVNDGVVSFRWKGAEASTMLSADNLKGLQAVLQRATDTELRLQHAGNATIVTHRGREFPINLADRVELSVFIELMLEDCYHIDRLPPSMDTVVDLGANIGFFAVLLGDRATRVVAVEAMKPTAAVARTNISRYGLSGKVEVVNAAMSGRTGETITLWGSSSGEPITTTSLNKELAERGGGDQPFAISTLSLGDLFRQQKVMKCDLLKVDIESAEFDLFEAADGTTLQSIERVLMEVHLIGSEKTVQRYEALKEKFRKAGFHVWCQGTHDGSGVKHVTYMTASRDAREELRAG